VNEWSGRAAVRGNKRLAVVAPAADAELVTKTLHGCGIFSTAITAAQLIGNIPAGEYAAAVIAAESLSSEDISRLQKELLAQPPWSDFPFVLIVGRDLLDDGSGLVQALGHATVVERPIHAPALINAAQAALRSRARQREAEAYLLQREGAEEYLRQLTSTLETRVRERMSEIQATNKRLVEEVRERQAAEERLRESEELYRHTVELSQQMVWTADPAGNFTYFSPRFKELTGATVETPPQEVIHPEDVERVLDAWMSAVAEGRKHVVEFRMLTLEGSYRMFRSRAAPHRDARGRIVRWYGYTEDVHDQKAADAARQEAEERLRESEELHRYTLELSQQLAWTADANGKFLTISDRFTDLTGLPIGPQRRAIHPEDVDRVMGSWWDCVASGQPHVAEFRMRVRDGSYRTFRARAAPRRDADGRIVQWYGATESIHEQTQAEAARKEAEERYRLVAKATNDAIWDLDLATGQIVWNDSVSSVFGYSLEGQGTDLAWWEEKLHPDDRERVAASLEAAVEGGATRWSAGYRFRVASGNYAHIFDRGFIIRDADGRAVRAVGAMMDMTERRRVDAELRQMQAELIHVSRLSAMGTMASTLAHELNQPLTAVTNYVHGSRRLLQEDAAGQVPQVLEALEAAEAASLRAGQIVRKLRELVSRGNVSPGPEELPKLIEDASLIGFVDEHLHGVTHRTELDPSATWVNVDRIQIQQVLINLIRNAVQAMQDQPRREVTIRTRTVSSELAEVSVADTGSGIPPDVREALFSPFKSTKADGMGIGLSISRTIVEAHGGKIWADDSDGGGAVFRFTLPRMEAPEDEAGAPS